MAETVEDIVKVAVIVAVMVGASALGIYLADYSCSFPPDRSPLPPGFYGPLCRDRELLGIILLLACFFLALSLFLAYLGTRGHPPQLY